MIIFRPRNFFRSFFFIFFGAPRRSPVTAPSGCRRRASVCRRPGVVSRLVGHPTGRLTNGNVAPTARCRQKKSRSRRLASAAAPVVRFVLFCFAVRGAGGHRTLVQTDRKQAFHMLLSAFDFRASARPEPPTDALSPKTSSTARGCRQLSPILLHHLVKMPRSNGSWVMSRSNTWCRNKANLLCFS